jgi:hypothetical protein
MTIAGHDLETGVRVVLERPGSGGPPWRYEGEAVTQEARFRVAAVVDGAGAVAVEVPMDAPATLAAKVRLIVRTAWRHASDGETDPPRRLARWRADR